MHTNLNWNQENFCLKLDCGAPSQITLFPGNVVWLDDITSTRALINLSRMLDKKEVTDTDSSKPAELSDQPQKGLSSHYTSPDISLCNLEIDAPFCETNLSRCCWSVRRNRSSDDEEEEEEEGEVDDDDDDDEDKVVKADKSRSSDGSEGKASDIEEETEKKPKETAEVNY